jgi:hypothetical protein
MTLRPPRRPAAIAFAALLALSCGHSKSSPSSPAPTPSTPVTPTPIAYSCPFGRGTTQVECSRATPTQLLDAVDTAIELVAQQKPGVLDTAVQDPPKSGQYHIVDKKAYTEAVIGNLRAAGMCAEGDYDFPLDRISVKASNDSSEDFTIVYNGEYVRRGHNSYRQSCSPAAFPVDPDPSWPPAGSGCGKPYPAEIHHFNAKVWLPGTEYATLDSTPIVGPDANYCKAVGYTDGRPWCPVRGEGAGDRVACEAWRVGKAKDTGRDGPTWYYYPPGTPLDGVSGQLCLGLGVNGCANHTENQYKLYVAGSGTFMACGQNGACGTVSR